MNASSDLLWWVNNEYRKRLRKVETYIDLLEQLMLARDQFATDHARILEALRYLQQQVDALVEEHRGWRYAYYYDSADSKRMVQRDEQINRALAYFSRMRSKHEQRIDAVYSAMSGVPRPDPDLTLVPNGDLWVMMQYAFDELAAFIDAPDAIA